MRSGPCPFQFALMAARRRSIAASTSEIANTSLDPAMLFPPLARVDALLTATIRIRRHPYLFLDGYAASGPFLNCLDRGLYAAVKRVAKSAVGNVVCGVLDGGNGRCVDEKLGIMGGSFGVVMMFRTGDRKDHACVTGHLVFHGPHTWNV